MHSSRLIECQRFDFAEIITTIKDGDGNITFTVTNISKETIDINVDKVWIGPAGESARVYFYMTNSCGTDLVAEGGSHTFYDLYKYDQTTGMPIVYTLQEEALANAPHQYQGYFVVPQVLQNKDS